MVVYHADWGTAPKKRWLCNAVLEGDGYRAHSPALVGDHRGFMNRVKNETGETLLAMRPCWASQNSNPSFCNLEAAILRSINCYRE